MGTRGIFQVYNASTETYTYYYIHNDSLIVLKELRAKLIRSKTLKGINKLIAGLVANGILRENQLDKPGTEPYTATKCWPTLEFSLTIKLNNFTEETYDEHWLIEPVFETLETAFALAKHQRAALYSDHNPKNGELVKKSVTKHVAEKRPRGRPRLTQEEKDARAAARTLLKLHEGPKAMAPRSQLAPWTEEELTPDGLVC